MRVDISVAVASHRCHLRGGLSSRSQQGLPLHLVIGAEVQLARGVARAPCPADRIWGRLRPGRMPMDPALPAIVVILPPSPRRCRAGGAGRVIGADQPMARLVAAMKHGPPRGAGPAACNGQPAPVSPGSSERGVNATRGETSAMAARSRCRGGPWAELAAGLKPQASTASP